MMARLPLEVSHLFRVTGCLLIVSRWLSASAFLFAGCFCIAGVPLSANPQRDLAELGGGWTHLVAW